jgi:hypothetical protein
VQPVEEAEPVPDLMAALEASLAAVRSEEESVAAKPKRPAAKSRAREGSAADGDGAGAGDGTARKPSAGRAKTKAKK